MISGCTAQQLEVVRDVAGAAAELAPHVGHQERDIEDVDLVGQDVVAEAVAEHHDGVVGDGAADQGVHGAEACLSGSVLGWWSALGDPIRTRQAGALPFVSD